MQRRSGILLPVASLPSPFGIGDFGPAAFRFVDWLALARQHAWEVLPLLLTDGAGSPFSPPSSLAMNWMLISPEQLVRDGRLTRRELTECYRGQSPINQPSNQRINYPIANRTKRRVLEKAWQHFRAHGTAAGRRRYRTFLTAERSWLDDFCLFMTIKDAHGGSPWWTWPARLRDQDRGALADWRRTHQEGIDYYAFGQWVAREQWVALRRYARRKGVKIIGDLPYGVTRDSVDVWANRDLFRLHSDGALSVVSGAPPDVFYAKGQVWGNPLYNWSALKRTRFRFWIKRIRTALDWYDEVRLDHFRGFHSVWSIPARPRPVARRGHWERVPGDKLLAAIRRKFPRAPLIAEDLGKKTPAVAPLLERHGLPGMRIVQFGFRKPLAKHHHPSLYPKHSVAYTGTHDMPPLRAWLRRLSDVERAAIRKTFGTIPTVRELVRTALGSKSDTALIPIMDLLELGATARLNTPGIVSRRNWTWQMQNLPPRSLARWLREETKRANR